MNSSSLHHLIHTLSGTEKRHFVLYASRHSGKPSNVTLRLFQDLEREAVWDKKDFLSRRKDRPYIKHFRFHIHHLFQEILQSLHLYHRKSSIREELRQEIHHSSLLMSKGLFKEAKKKISIAILKAEEFQESVTLYELIKMEGELAREMNFSGYMAEDLKKIHQRMREVWERINREREIESSSAEIFLQVSRDGHIQDLKKQTHYISRLEQLQSEKGDTFRGCFLREQSRLFMYTVRKDFESGKTHSDLILDLFQRHPHMQKEALRTWIISLHNHAVVLNNLKLYQELPDVFRKLATIRPSNPQLRSRQFYSLYNLRLTTFNETGEPRAAMQILIQMQSELKRKGIAFLNKQHEISHAFSAMLCGWENRDWKVTSRYLRQILQAEIAGQREDIRMMTHVLRPFIYIVSDKMDLVPLAIRDALHYLRDGRSQSSFVKCIADFFRTRLPSMHSEAEIKGGIRELLQHWSLLEKEPSFVSASELFDLYGWLKAYIAATPFSEYLNERAKRYGWNDSIRERLSSPAVYS